jgi:hypothetical protein
MPEWVEKLISLLSWPTVVLIGIGFFRRSISALISRRLSKLGPAEFEKESEEQKKEIETKQLEKFRAEPLQLVARSAPIDPVIAPQVQALRAELDQRATDPQQREELLLQSVATWQLNHKHARTARFIFGSQVQLLQELNGKPIGESLENLKKHYNEAVQTFPNTYQNYSYAQYMKFLNQNGLIMVIVDRVTLTPEGRAFLAYLVWSGDTVKKAN